MKLLLALLSVLLLTGTFYMHYNIQTEEEMPWEDEMDNSLEQPTPTSAGLVFFATENCFLGSKYKLGEGCEDSRFSNQDEILDEKVRSKPIGSTELKYFKATSASEIMKLTSHRNNFQGGGWGFKIKTKVEVLDKSIHTANTLTVVLTDFRKHTFQGVTTNLWKFDQRDLDDFTKDPERWYEYNGFFFVSGMSYGSTFQGTLNYFSYSSSVLHDVSVSVDVSFSMGFFSFGASHDYRGISDTKDGKAEFKSSVKTFGAGGESVYETTDLYESHKIFMAACTKENAGALSVTLSKFESHPEFRDMMRNVQDQQEQQNFREYNRIPSTFLKTISSAYTTYIMMLRVVEDTLMGYGATMSQNDQNKLYSYKQQINDRMEKIEQLHSIKQINEVNKNRRAATYLEYIPLFIEIDKVTRPLQKY